MLVGNENICPLCFEKMSDNQTECYRCNGVSNLKKYPTSLEEGTILNGKYMIGKVIGRGGFGITYLALDLALMTKVAIKEFYPGILANRDTGSTGISPSKEEYSEDFSKGRESFAKEAQIISKLSHNRNIVRVYNLFYENNTAYYVMEYLEGVDMKDYIKNLGGKLTEAETFNIMNDIFPALTSVHTINMLHRDISPDNIFICNDGRIKLIDFGAARQVFSEETKTLTVILKPGFAPFEQYKTHGKQGPWTDIYALGATIYYALTGKILLDAPSRTDNPYIDMTGIRTELASVLSKMLSVDIESRYKSVEEVAADLMKINADKGAVVKTVKKTEKLEYCIKQSPNQSDFSTPVHNHTVSNASENNHFSETEKAYDNTPKTVHPTTDSNSNSPSISKIIAVTLGIVFALIAIGVTIEDSNPVSDTTTDKSSQLQSESSYDSLSQVTENPTVSSSDITANKSDILFAVKEENSWSIVNGKGETVTHLDPYITDVTGFINGISSAKKNNKWGVINTKGEVIQDFSYNNEPRWDNENRVASIEKNDKYALMNSEGDIVTDFIYDSIYFYDVIEVVINDKYGVINSDGETIVPVKYNYINTIGNTITIFSEGDYGYGSFSYTFSNTEDMYNCKEKFPEPLFPIKIGNLYGYCNTEGETVFDAKWQYAGFFNEGYAVVKTKEGYNYIDINGKEIFSDTYDYASGFGCGLAHVEKNNSYGFLNADGTVAIDFKYYDSVLHFYPEGYALITDYGKNGTLSKSKHGAMNKNGKVFIQPKYDTISKIAPELYCVTNNDKSGLIDSSGKILLECEYSKIHSSYTADSIITVVTESGNKNYSYADGALHFIGDDLYDEEVDFYYSPVKQHKNGYFIVEKNKKYGVVDNKGNTVIDSEYSFMHFSKHSDYIIASKDGYYGCINTQGETILDFSYSDII